MDGFSTKSKCSGSTLIVAKRTSRLSNAIMHRSSPCAIVARFNPYDRKSPSTFISLKYDKLVHSTFNQAKFTLIADLPIYYQPRGKLSSQKCSTIITHTSRWLETDLFELFSTLKWLSLYLQGSELSWLKPPKVVPIRQALRSGLPSCNKYKRGKMLFRINLQK